MPSQVRRTSHLPTIDAARGLVVASASGEGAWVVSESSDPPKGAPPPVDRRPRGSQCCTRASLTVCPTTNGRPWRTPGDMWLLAARNEGSTHPVLASGGATPAFTGVRMRRPCARLLLLVSMKKGCLSTGGRWFWVRDLAWVGEMWSDAHVSMASSAGGSGEIGCFARGRKSKEGGQAARRTAAPLGANCWL